MFFFSDRSNADLAIIQSKSPFSVFSVALLLLCRGTWLIELMEKLGLRPPHYSFLGATAGVRYGMRSVLQKNSSSRHVCYFL